MRNATGTFRIGDMEVFQDKPSKELQLALECMHKKDYEKANWLVDNTITEIAELLKNKTEAELSVVLKSIIRRTNEYKSNQEDCNAVIK
jgi:hypothetical protein